MRDIFSETNPRVTEIFERWESAYQESRVLQVAGELGNFPAVAGGFRTAEDLARQLHLDTAGVSALCTALVAMGLLEFDGKTYRNTDVAEACLIPGSPLYRGDGIMHGADGYFRWADLAERVRTGQWLAEGTLPGQDQTAWHRSFILGMHQYSVAGRAQTLALAVDLTDEHRLLDLGGGPGTYSIALCQRFPQLHSTIYDLESTHVYARDTIAAYGMESRIHLQAGNWNDPVWGHDYDAVLMSNVLHGRTELNRMKMRKAYASLHQGGRFLVHDFVIDPDARGPLDAALFGLHVGAYRLDELLEDLRDAGFIEARHVPLTDTPQTLVVSRR